MLFQEAKNTLNKYNLNLNLDRTGTVHYVKPPFYLAGEKFNRYNLEVSIDRLWEKHYNKTLGFKRTEIKMSDGEYFAYEMYSAKKITEDVMKFMAKNNVVYIPQSQDCDDFMIIFKAGFTIYSNHYGMPPCGSGVGNIKVSFKQNGQLLYHAMNFIALVDDYTQGADNVYNGLMCGIIEPQTGEIYKSINHYEEKENVTDFKIHFFNM